jgi:DNA invertase Pin-like site-specific DNA recombinase
MSEDRKPLRFASLVRVSTEKQEKLGESLVTQRKSNERDVQRLGGRIVDRYGGQEHATAGWERREIDRLLADTARGKFDAVIVAYADRWSRDNAKSKEGLEAFRKHGIKFYVGSMEMDLFDPQHRFILGMNAEVGEFVALQQAKKSIETRIERAQNGIPASGRLPFGRTFDPKTNEWGIDKKAQAMIANVATRYIAGESLPKLAKEVCLNHSGLCRILRERCGTEWVCTFDDDRLNIHETVTMRIPRLLPEITIKAVRRQLERTPTNFRRGGRVVHSYLLSGCVFCEECGYAMVGRTTKHGTSYYKHTVHEGSGKCPLIPRPLVRADKLEAEVISQLFNLFGNPTAIQRAVQAGVPDCDEMLKRRQHLAADLARVEKARANVLLLVEREALTMGQAEKKLKEYKDREAALREDVEKVEAALAEVPDEESVRCYVDRINDQICVIGDDGQPRLGGNDLSTLLTMTGEERRRLVEAVFHTPMADGTPAGVYVRQEGQAAPHRPKTWGFAIKGRLDFELVLKCTQQPRRT